MIYNPYPPYEILQTKLIDFVTMQKLRRFARYWDLVGNSGNFVETLPLIWSSLGRASFLSPSVTMPSPPNKPVAALECGPFAERATPAKTGSKSALQSPFYAFLDWSQWLHARVGRTDSIALVRLMDLLFTYLTGEVQIDAKRAALALWHDYQRGGRRDKPAFLKPFLPAEEPPRVLEPVRSATLKRQGRHQHLKC
jgi:hypothetical protein